MSPSSACTPTVRPAAAISSNARSKSALAIFGKRSGSVSYIDSLNPHTPPSARRGISSSPPRLADRAQQRHVGHGFGLEARNLALQALARVDRLACVVGHLDDGRYAARGRCPGRIDKAFLRRAEAVHVGVDRARQDPAAWGVDAPASSSLARARRPRCARPRPPRRRRARCHWGSPRRPRRPGRPEYSSTHKA